MTEITNSNQTQAQQKYERVSGDSSSPDSKKSDVICQTEVQQKHEKDFEDSSDPVLNMISSLPPDMVFLILDKFSELVDHVRFAAVCKDWRSFAEDYNHVKKCWRLLPMLLMTNQADQNVFHRFAFAQENIKVYEISHDVLPSYNGKELVAFAQENIKVYEISHDVLPSYNGKKLVGASHGWLATVELVDQLLTITLLDNFRKEVSPIVLPPLDFNSPFGEKNPEKFSYSVSHVRNIILSADPKLNPENYFAIAFYNHEEGENFNLPANLAFIKGGQNYWTCYIKQRFTNAIFYKNNVYAVGTRGTIVSFDIGRHYNLPQPQKVQPLPKILTPRNVLWRRADMEYLVESTKGNLWHLRRFSICIGGGDSRLLYNAFEVYKVVFNDIDGTILEQANVISLGDEALFVGGINHPVSITVSRFPRCQPNSIYIYHRTSWNLQFRCLR